MSRSRSRLPVALAEGVRRFERWRGTRTSRQIPEALWNLATGLGKEYGVNKTAQSLRLDYYALQQRVKGASRDEVSGAELRPTFIEVLPAECVSARECLVELEDARGVKMRVHFKGACAPELAALGQLFFEQRS